MNRFGKSRIIYYPLELSYTTKSNWYKYSSKSFKYFFRATSITLQLTLAYILLNAYNHNHPFNKAQLEEERKKRGIKKKKIVILGTGWGATSLLKSIDAQLYDIVFSLCLFLACSFAKKLFSIYSIITELHSRNFGTSIHIRANKIYNQT